MKKIVIHSEPVTKPKEKFPFQVKIPQNVTRLTGIHVCADFPFSPTNEDFLSDAQSGDLWLSVANAPEFFYTELVRLTDFVSIRLRQIHPQGISYFGQQWFQNKEHRSAFNITINQDNEFIEGFYQSSVNWNHVLKIYLEFDD